MDLDLLFSSIESMRRLDFLDLPSAFSENSKLDFFDLESDSTAAILLFAIISDFLLLLSKF
jgi:hypothetical protein